MISVNVYFERYKSRVIVIPVMRRKFKMLPTPKYLSIINIVVAKAIIIPLLALIVIVAVVKRTAKKNTNIVIGIIPKVKGSKK